MQELFGFGYGGCVAASVFLLPLIEIPVQDTTMVSYFIGEAALNDDRIL
jgi:hypothetical protein